jgi:hypothetical protein
MIWARFLIMAHTPISARKIMTQCVILTNGTIMPDNRILAMRNIKFCIPMYGSYDSLHNWHTRSDSFFTTLKTLYRISQDHVPIELRFVVTEKNYMNIGLFAEFIHFNLPFVANVAFMGMELMESAKVNENMLWVKPLQFMPLIEDALSYLGAFSIPCSVYNIPLCLFSKDFRKHAYAAISEHKKTFLPLCTQCHLKPECGGFFQSNLPFYQTIITEAPE